MNILGELRRRFATALETVIAQSGAARAGAERAGATRVDVTQLGELVQPSQNPDFGDYQANCAMPLGKRLSLAPREVAQRIVDAVDVHPLCHPPQIAGPGFINLRLDDGWLAHQLTQAIGDPRLGVERATPARTFVIDYSAPNVAKPMHVGHVRSTVIGDSLYRTLKFLGHLVTSDNHLGDWGTQFGMILYGYHHFRRPEAYQADAVGELARLYRLVHTLADYHEARQARPVLEKRSEELEDHVQRQVQAKPAPAAKSDKKADQARRRAEADLAKARDELEAVRARIAQVDQDPELSALASEHPDIREQVLAETARLHEGDPENVRLWKEFMPACLAALETSYRRLGVTFDRTLGESFYHDRLAGVVNDLLAKQIARESDGAICIFFDDDPVPMIVRKRDGAFLYATTDLATIEYRLATWSPDAILYVVDHRQSDHFRHLFAAARKWLASDVELAHISFGTVLGDDGKPYRTRSGDTVGLEGLLDEAVTRAAAIVAANDDGKPDGPELSAQERRRVAETVGIAALKYADLSQNRTSDYVFSYDKMLAMTGNTATYMQYAYARVRSIFRRGKVDIEALRASGATIELGAPAERELAIALLRFSEALQAVCADYRPNQLTSYLFELANRYSTFFEQCPVLRAETEPLRASRLLLCDLTARTIQQGLALLGIQVVEQM